MLLAIQLGALLVLVPALFRRVTNKHWDLLIAWTLPLFWLGFVLLAIGTSRVRPITLDAQFRRLDLAMGLDGVAFTRWLMAHGLFRFVEPIYDLLPIVMVLPWALERSKKL